MARFIDFATSRAAVEFARSKQRSGEFDLFRGQASCWPVRSSWRRIQDPKLREQAVNRVNEFVVWAKAEPLLAGRLTGSDDAIAIAQHYGLPTPFIDLTTDPEVARFFSLEQAASHIEVQTTWNAKRASRVGEALRSWLPAKGSTRRRSVACIIAISVNHLSGFIQAVGRPTQDSPGAEILRLDVGNLWRLEAQAGLFLADDKILDLYRFTYLTFPVSGEVSEYPRNQIYPDEQSDLELTVEQYLQHEQLSANSSLMKSTLGDKFQVMSVPDPGDIGRIGVKAPPPLASWDIATSSLPSTSRYSLSARQRGNVIRIDVPTCTNRTTWTAAIDNQKPADKVFSQLRTASTTFSLLHDGEDHPAVRKALERQWDAIRAEPYSNNQIWDSIRQTLLLDSLRTAFIDSGEAAESIARRDKILANRAYGGDLEVEFATTVGYSRAVISAQRLYECRRANIEDFVPNDVFRFDKNLVERMSTLIGAVRRPSLIFEFEPFADLYVTQVVPYASALRAGDPLYSVLRINIFGEP